MTRCVPATVSAQQHASAAAARSGNRQRDTFSFRFPDGANLPPVVKIWVRRRAASVTVALSKEVNPDGTFQSDEVTRLALCSLKEGL
jgi:hypothetical protein